ncbi:MAG TPA: phage tail tape measure protein [Devosiaceae bacterium]
MNDTLGSVVGGLQGDLGGISGELQRIGSLADGVARAMTGAFRAAALDGNSLKSVLADVAKSLADIALKAALKPLGNLMSGAVNSLFSAMDPTLSKVTPFARGGVLSAPAYFPMNPGGVGLAGEAGPEAIMPLRRGSDGRLGVAMSGSATPNITVNVTATDARSFLGAEAEMSAMLLRAVRRGTRAS